MYSDKWKEIWKKGKEKRFNLGAKRKIVEDEHRERERKKEWNKGNRGVIRYKRVHVAEAEREIKRGPAW